MLPLADADAAGEGEPVAVAGAEAVTLELGETLALGVAERDAGADGGALRDAG